jgi:hypothetical protein
VPHRYWRTSDDEDRIWNRPEGDRGSCVDCATGHEVNVWNRSAGKARALEVHGARAFDDAAAALVGAERIHLSLSDDVGRRCVEPIAAAISKQPDRRPHDHGRHAHCRYAAYGTHWQDVRSRASSWLP